MVDNKYDEEFFIKLYNGQNMRCRGSHSCSHTDDCVMFPIQEKQGDKWVKNPARAEIIQGLAKLTVELNKRISDLFGRVNDGQLPITPPTFILEMYTCKSYKAVEIDFGD